MQESKSDLESEVQRAVRQLTEGIDTYNSINRQFFPPPPPPRPLTYWRSFVIVVVFYVDICMYLFIHSFIRHTLDFRR